MVHITHLSLFPILPSENGYPTNPIMSAARCYVSTCLILIFMTSFKLYIPWKSISWYQTVALTFKVGVSGGSYSSILPIVPFDPICKVLFHINGRTVTGDISTAIKHSLFAPKLQEYQCNRFGWSVSLHNILDWEIFSQVYSSYPRSRNFFYQLGWKCWTNKDFGTKTRMY